jgi:hypothetical protein
MSLWLNARAGWLFPFGNAWAKGHVVTPPTGPSYIVLDSEPWTNYAQSGPTFELNAGARIARSYMVFALWERTQTRAGKYVSPRDGEQTGGDTDFWALGLRANSDPDRLGFITEVAIGYRRARTRFENDTEYQFTDAPFEARLGLGAEYRTSRMMSFSLLGTVGVGAFGNIQSVSANGDVRSVTDGNDAADGHAWAAINVGASFDLLPSND